jgi:hypothetical protein
MLALAAPAAAADLVTKAAPLAAPSPLPWDIAFGGAVMTDYNFRGISQSDRGPSATAYFEPRLNINPNWQLYAGVQGWATKLPTDPTGEFDLYGGIRPTFGPLAFDFGAMYYYYPNETQIFLDPVTGGAGNPLIPGAIPWTKSDTDFWEVYAKVTWTANDWLAIGGYVYYAPDWLNTGADGTYFGGTVKVSAPSAWFPKDWGAYVSGELARYALGTTDAFFLFVDLPDYTYWNVGVAVTYKVFTLDLRYHGTDANRNECFVLTGDLRGLPGGGNTPGTSKWCGDAFIAKLSADLTVNTNLK